MCQTNHHSVYAQHFHVLTQNTSTLRGQLRRQRGASGRKILLALWMLTKRRTSYVCCAWSVLPTNATIPSTNTHGRCMHWVLSVWATLQFGARREIIISRSVAFANTWNASISNMVITNFASVVGAAVLRIAARNANHLTGQCISSLAWHRQ